VGDEIANRDPPLLEDLQHADPRGSRITDRARHTKPFEGDVVKNGIVVSRTMPLRVSPGRTASPVRLRRESLHFPALRRTLPMLSSWDLNRLTTSQLADIAGSREPGWSHPGPRPR
jgi:hypothetical protein